MKKLAILTIGFIIFLCLTGIGQINFYAYQKFKYEWTENQPVSIPLNPIFANEDAVYLKDQHVMSIAGSLGSVTNIVFQRKARIKFLTQKGIDKKSNIVLPETLDPMYDNHSDPFKNNKIEKGPTYFDLGLNWFAA